MNSGLAHCIDIAGVSKRFRRHTRHKSSYTTIKSSLVSGLAHLWRPGRRQTHYTEAIKNLTLRVPVGASVGVIGKNGSGKSTLLKLITGIYKPDSGRIAVHGRVAALIELGAGFHPDFTGRENLFLGGVMHGLARRQIAARFEEIVRFAGLEAVIDDPVRTYSSGMFMRLGFSLAVHTDPDILLIDEVLAVGDAAFVGKCKERLAQLRKDGKTLLLVSHDLEAVERWCDEALWLHDGEARDRGEPRRVIDAYLQHVERGEEGELQRNSIAAAEAAPADAAVQNPPAERWGSREVEITGARMLAKDGDARLLFHPGDAVRIEIAYRVHEQGVLAGDQIVFGIGINRSDGLLVFGTNTGLEKVPLPPLGKGGTVAHEISRLGLLEGNYSVDAAVHRPDGYPYDYRKGLIKFGVRCPLRQVGVFTPEHKWSIDAA